MGHQFTSSRMGALASRGRATRSIRWGVVLLAFTLLAACGVPTSATPPTNPNAHGLYITAIKTSATPTSGIDTVTITALGLSNGAPQWHVGAPWVPFVSGGSLIVSGNLVLAPVLSTASLNGNTPTSTLTAYDRQTGRQQWKVNEGAVISSVALIQGVVYTSAVLENPAHQGYQKVMMALRSTDGHILWRVAVPQVDGFHDNITAGDGVIYTVSNQICFDYCNDAYVFALRMSNGALLWEKTIPGNLTLAAPQFDHGMLYLQIPTDDPQYGASVELDAYHADSGALAWRLSPRQALGLEDNGTYTVSDGVVYVGVSHPVANDIYHERQWPYSLVALDGQTGALRWQTPTNLYPQVDTLNTQVVLVEDITEVEPSGNISAYYVSAFQRSDGKLLWRVQAPQQLGQPQMVGDSVVAEIAPIDVHQPGAALALNLADGRTLWRTSLGVSPTRPQLMYPVAVMNILNGVYYVTLDGVTLFALRISDGAVLWKTAPPGGITWITVM